MDSQLGGGIPLPHLIRHSNFIYTVRQESIRKEYSHYGNIRYYDMAFNAEHRSITHISLQGRFLTV